MKAAPVHAASTVDKGFGRNGNMGDSFGKSWFGAGVKKSTMRIIIRLNNSCTSATMPLNKTVTGQKCRTENDRGTVFMLTTKARRAMGAARR
jgi:hypothetical protein